MKVLFIGGSGTISSSSTRLLAESGFDVTVVVRGTRDSRLPPQVRVLHADIANGSQTAADLLKSESWDCVVDWIAYDEADVERDIELFEESTERYFFISSTAVYSKPLRSPHVNESTPAGDTGWAYADAKHRCEEVLLARHEETGFPVTIVRPGHTYNDFVLPTAFAGLGFGLAQRMVDGRPIVLHGDGTGFWTLLHSEDFARALLGLLAADDLRGETVQVTGTDFVPWVTIYDEIARAFSAKPEYVYASSSQIAQWDRDMAATLLGDKAHSYIFDDSKLRAVLGEWFPKVSIVDGLSRCAHWYSRHKDEISWSKSADELMDRIVGSIKKTV